MVKTREQQQRTFERKDDFPDRRQVEEARNRPPETPLKNPDEKARQSEFPVSRQGMNQESHHNKHNEPGQSGHKPQTHTADENSR
jgi:hypothetical protein